jgi:hypothetical protein
MSVAKGVLSVIVQTRCQPVTPSALSQVGVRVTPSPLRLSWDHGGLTTCDGGSNGIPSPTTTRYLSAMSVAKGVGPAASL